MGPCIFLLYFHLWLHITHLITPLHLPYDYLRKNKNQVFSDDHYLESEVV